MPDGVAGVPASTSCNCSPAGGDSVSRARCGSVAGITRVQSDLGSTPGHRFDCRTRARELVVPALAKSISRQRHIDVRFYAPAFDDGAAPSVPARLELAGGTVPLRL
jgi:hypothetical protein